MFKNEKVIKKIQKVWFFYTPPRLAFFDIGNKSKLYMQFLFIIKMLF